jgi:hypothetical protein
LYAGRSYVFLIVEYWLLACERIGIVPSGIYEEWYEISVADPERSETFGHIRIRNRKKRLYQFRIRSGSGQKFRILPGPDPVLDEILSYLVRLDGRPRSTSGLGLLSKNVKYLLCTIQQNCKFRKSMLWNGGFRNNPEK